MACNILLVYMSHWKHRVYVERRSAYLQESGLENQQIMITELWQHMAVLHDPHFQAEDAKTTWPGTRGPSRTVTWNWRLRHRREPLTGVPATRPHHLDEVTVPSAARTGRTSTTQAATWGLRAGDSDFGDESDGRRAWPRRRERDRHTGWRHEESQRWIENASCDVARCVEVYKPRCKTSRGPGYRSDEPRIKTRPEREHYKFQYVHSLRVMAFTV